MTYTDQVNRLTRQYNDAIHALEDSYDIENSQLGWNLSSSYLTEQYSRKYEVLAREYRQKRHELFWEFKQQHPEWAKWRRIWGWVFVLGILAMVVSCVSQLPVAEEMPTSQAVSNTEEHYWSAADIPIPYLKDSTQYVSNPDHVLSHNTTDRMNATLKRLEKELGVQSVFIIVNHIANDDPFRMAQDVGNRYGVGYGDRGLIVVVGYQDHSINISPGRSLEADLTDVECHRLEQKYVVPAMRAEQPDSAMLYLSDAIFSTLQKKALPVMQLSSQDDDIDDEVATIMGIYLLLMVGWCVFFLRLNQKYQWVGILGIAGLIGNPFYIEESIHYGGGGFGGGSFGGGGGGFSGGSFGGGSFGGGGATSRW